MGEFAESIRAEAASAFWFLTKQECPHGADPLVELIAHLLDAGGADATANSAEFAMGETWITWNRSLAERPRAVRAAMNATLEWEKPPLPKSEGMMQGWAARLVICTLARLNMA